MDFLVPHRVLGTVRRVTVISPREPVSVVSLAIKERRVMSVSKPEIYLTEQKSECWFSKKKY